MRQPPVSPAIGWEGRRKHFCPCQSPLWVATGAKFGGSGLVRACGKLGEGWPIPYLISDGLDPVGPSPGG